MQYKRLDRYVHGYKAIYKPEHPTAIKTGGYKGYVYEHRYVMEVFLGRCLEDGECIHHKDKNRSNNSIENLQLFCSVAEHSKHHAKEDGKILSEDKKCLLCGTNVSSKAKYCISCWLKTKRKVEWPSREELENNIKTFNWCQLGRMYGVSDNAVRKWARNYGLL